LRVWSREWEVRESGEGEKEKEEGNEERGKRGRVKRLVDRMSDIRKQIHEREEYLCGIRVCRRGEEEN
jgi:hypothetical protein